MGIFVKDTHFELINELIKPDAKKRLSLGSAAAQAGVTYNIYRNQIGQIMLDPVKTVPVYETKLYQNKLALAAVKRGLAQTTAGRTKKRGSFAIYTQED
jgi:hypothetical protein